MGYEFDISEDNLKEDINKLLRDIKGTNEENMIGTLVTRCMSKAYYTTQDVSHFGLGFDDYGHFTSPIRRYPDIIQHRLLEEVISWKK